MELWLNCSILYEYRQIIASNLSTFGLFAAVSPESASPLQIIAPRAARQWHAACARPAMSEVADREADGQFWAESDRSTLVKRRLMQEESKF